MACVTSCVHRNACVKEHEVWRLKHRGNGLVFTSSIIFLSSCDEDGSVLSRVMSPYPERCWVSP